MSDKISKHKTPKKPVQGSRAGSERVASDSIDSETVSAKADSVGSLKAGFRKFLFNEANKINRKAKEYILGVFAKLEDLTYELRLKNERLEGRLHEKGDLEALLRRAEQPVTYADTLRAGRPLGRRGPETPPKQHVVIVKPQVDTDMPNSEEVKQKVVEVLGPSIKEIGVKALRKLRDKSVVIEMAAEIKSNKVKAEIVKNKSLAIKTPATLKPRVIAYDIPKVKPQDEVFNEVYEKNFEHLVTREEFDAGISLAFKTGRRKRRPLCSKRERPVQEVVA